MSENTNTRSKYESPNFLAAILTISLSFLAFNGIDLDENAIQNVVDSMIAGQYFAGAVAIVPLLASIVRVVKKAKEKLLDWSFFWQRNTIAQLVSLLALALAHFGVIEPSAGFGLAASINVIISTLFFKDEFKKVEQVNTRL